MIFVASLIIRLLALWLVPKVDCYDATEYHTLSYSLTPQSRFGYTKWYHRTPAYVAWLHFWGQSILPQILFSSYAIYELSQVNLYAGLLMMCYTVPYDINYLKESILYPTIALIATLGDPMLKFALVLLVMLPFQSYGAVWTYNKNLKLGTMRAFFDMWKPTFGVWDKYGPAFSYLFAIPYAALMLYWFRFVDPSDVSVALFMVFNLVYMFMGYSESRFREPVMLFIILSVIK